MAIEATSAPLTKEALAAAPPGVQKQMIGERLFPIVMKLHPTMASKITVEMLKMDNSKILLLLESEDRLKEKAEQMLGFLSLSNI